MAKAVMRPSRLFSSYIGLILLFGVSLAWAAPDSPPQLSIRFTTQDVEFSGVIDSEESGLLLAGTVNSIRPDLNIVNLGLQISPDVIMPDLEDIRSLLQELGLSTHEGMLVMWDDRVLLSGLTDSVITLTALKIRLAPILRGRTLINRLCIVPTEDLPEIQVNLTRVISQEQLIHFDTNSSGNGAFELPGLAIGKIYPTLVMLSDLSQIDGSIASSVAPIRALPLNVASKIPKSPSLGSTPSVPVLQATPAVSVPRRAAFPPILFSRSTQILQSSQEAVIDELVKQLKIPPLLGMPITVSPIRFEGGTPAFTDYLCENRGNSLQSKLIEKGIDRSLISIRVLRTSVRTDKGEVLMFVELPPEELIEDSALEMEAGDGSLPTDSAPPLPLKTDQGI